MFCAATRTGLLRAASTTAGRSVGDGQSDDLGVLLLGDERDEGLDEGDGFFGRLVHLPVGGDELLAHDIPLI